MTKKEWADQSEIARNICLQITKFGVTDFQILKIIDILSLELIDRQQMLAIREAVSPMLETFTADVREKIEEKIKNEWNNESTND
jgi:hypothetical protein